MVRKEGNVAEDEQSQAAQRFVSAEQLCNSFTLKTLGKLDPMEFLEALQDHIQGTDHAIEDWLRTVAISGSPRQKGAALSLLVAVTGRALRRGAYARIQKLASFLWAKLPLPSIRCILRTLSE
jgi:hypothetical protein